MSFNIGAALRFLLVAGKGVADVLLCCSGTGHLSEQELGAALVNGDYTSFDPHTVKMMIRWASSHNERAERN